MTSDFGHRAGAALVVGGTGGLGSAVAAMLAVRGSAVAVTYRRNQDGARGLPAWQLDVTDPDRCALVVEQVAEAHGGLLPGLGPGRVRQRQKLDVDGGFGV